MTVNVGEPARLMLVNISRELLQQLMTEGWTVGGETRIRCTRGLPEGARVAWQTVPAQPVELVFEHESFPLIGYGERIPTMVCEFSVEEGGMKEHNIIRASRYAATIVTLDGKDVSEWCTEACPDGGWVTMVFRDEDGFGSLTRPFPISVEEGE